MIALPKAWGSLFDIRDPGVKNQEPPSNHPIFFHQVLYHLCSSPIWPFYKPFYFLFRFFSGYYTAIELLFFYEIFKLIVYSCRFQWKDFFLHYSARFLVRWVRTKILAGLGTLARIIMRGPAQP